MSAEASPTGKPDSPEKSTAAQAAVNAVAAETAAANYLTGELEKARKSCGRTRTIGAVAVIIVFAYMSFITTQLSKYFEPKAAADMANTFIGAQVTEKATDLSSELKTRIPELIAELPSFVMQQLPDYRIALEKKIEGDFAEYCHATSRQMGKHFDDYLDAHVVQIRAVLAATQDRHAIKQLGPDIEQTILEYLSDRPEDGESIKEKIEKSLTALKNIENQMDRLALGKDLTPQEKKTRRIIAMIAKAVEDQAPDSADTKALPLPMPKKPKSTESKKK